MPREYWWGSVSTRGGSPIASPRLQVEAGVWKNQLEKGSVKRFKADVGWDLPCWVFVEDIEKGWDPGNRFYVILTIRFAERERRGQPEWETTRYKIKVVYPADYPSQAPTAYAFEGTKSLRGTPHNYIDHAGLCLYSPHDGRQMGWDPAVNTGASIALWSIQWLRAYRVYERTGIWPGDSAH